MIHTISLHSRGPLALATAWLSSAFAALAAAAQRRADAARHRRLMPRTVEALRGLDARTLHDLGLHASEISSVAAEASGAIDHIEQTRARVWREGGHRVI